MNMECSESFILSIQPVKGRYNVVNQTQVSSLQATDLIISVLVNLHNTAKIQQLNFMCQFHSFPLCGRY